MTTKKITEIEKRLQNEIFDMQEKNRFLYDYLWKKIENLEIQCDIQKHEIAQLTILMENHNINVKNVK
jgi:hypothetical protein